MHCKRKRCGAATKQKLTATTEATMERKVIRDTEYDEEFTMTELREQYEELRAEGNSEAENFEDYLENITDKNGTCEWI